MTPRQPKPAGARQGEGHPQEHGVGEREERLREALLIALANNPLCDGLPDDLADATHLYDAGLLQLHRDFSDEHYTSITDAGREFILAALASSPSPPDREQAVDKVAKAVRRHLPSVWPGDESMVTNDEKAELAREAALDVVAALFGRGDES